MPSFLYQHFCNFDLSLSQRTSLLHQTKFGAETSRRDYEQVLALIKYSSPELFAELQHPYTGLEVVKSQTNPNNVLILSIHKHSNWYSYGRVYSKFTSMERQLRYLLFRKTLVELDAANFVPETLYQMTQKLRPKLNCPELARFVNNRESTYAKVSKLGLCDDPKTFVLKLLNQSELQKLPPQAFFLRKLQREVSRLKDIFNGVNPVIAVNPEKQRKPETALCRWIDTLEVSILEILVDHLQNNKQIKHCIPIHDGLLVNKDCNLSLQHISNVVFEETGFRYTYRLKQLKPNPESLYFLNYSL